MNQGELITDLALWSLVVLVAVLVLLVVLVGAAHRDARREQATRKGTRPPLDDRNDTRGEDR